MGGSQGVWGRDLTGGDHLHTGGIPHITTNIWAQSLQIPISPQIHGAIIQNLQSKIPYQHELFQPIQLVKAGEYNHNQRLLLESFSIPTEHKTNV